MFCVCGLYSQTDSVNFKEAFISYSQTLKLDTTNSELYVKRGLIKASLRLYSGKIVYDKPNASYAERKQTVYVNSELLKGDFGAIADFTKAIKINPNYFEAYYHRAMSFYFLNQYNNAIADFTRAIKINDKYAEAYYYRGLTKGVNNNMGGACLDFIKASDLGFKEVEKLVEDCK